MVLSVAVEAPVPRFNHESTVVGNKMIVVGGGFVNEILDDVQVLNFNSFSWTIASSKLYLSPSNLPLKIPSCKGHVLVSWGKKTLLIGDQADTRQRGSNQVAVSLLTNLARVASGLGAAASILGASTYTVDGGQRAVGREVLKDVVAQFNADQLLTESPQGQDHEHMLKQKMLVLEGKDCIIFWAAWDGENPIFLAPAHHSKLPTKCYKRGHSDELESHYVAAPEINSSGNSENWMVLSVAVEAPVPRFNHASTVVGNKMIVVGGGFVNEILDDVQATF
ncbi:acyl-CoA-binding domain-containing protein 6-like [Hibiscus syriacus]|uniref:acyl-CoA-binding domain-containing protein 6-like n=1 Tax=Hibiscus syriacus TaxID=106335 RepID=UPI001923FD01|nr:acyl-CoA-binding domain-containing protein 6-like [Hibiscus syriacus]